MELIVDDVIQVSVNGEIGGRACTNVFHIDASRPITGDSATKAEALLAAYQEHLVPLFSTAYTLLGATFIDLDSVTGDSGSLGPVAGQPDEGTRLSGASPQIAMLVRKNVSNSPRGISFRMFLPPPGDADVDDEGNLGGAFFDNIQTNLDNFQSDVDVSSGPGVSESHLCCVSYPRDDDGHVTGPGTAYDLDTYSIMTKVATQRRRLRG